MNPELLGPLSEAAEVVTLDKDLALEKFKEYKAAVRTGRTQHDSMMREVYRALSEGRGVINPRAAIVKAGMNALGFPKLAICRADFPLVFFHRVADSQAFYSTYATRYLGRLNKQAQAARMQYAFTNGEFNLSIAQRPNHTDYWKVVKAMLPIIPPQHRPTSFTLSQYNVLWEVDKWEVMERQPRVPGDPMLLKPLGRSGLYAVMAHWDLTDIERLVLGAMLGN